MYSDRKQAAQWLPEEGGAEGTDYKGSQGHFGDDRHVNYLKCSDDVMGICLCQNLSKCTLQVGESMCQ